MIRKSIGSFINESGKFAISDPCYDIDVWCRGELENVKPGTWNAEIGMINARNSCRTYIALLIATHESYDEDATGNLTKAIAEFEVGVDSGQASIFDVKHYRDDTVFGETEKGSSEKWYDHCSCITLSRAYAGVIPFGVVSLSGYGDGSYVCTYYTDCDGHIVQIVITFINDEHEEDNID